MKNIADIIPFGRENAISREALARAYGASDRTTRNAIERARRDGHIIINKQDGNGYYQTGDLQEIKAQYNRNRNRALSILVQQKHLRAKLTEGGIEC